MATKALPKSAKSTAPKKPVAKIDSSVPDKKHFDGYISRNIVQGKSEFDVFDYARAEKQNVLIEGPTGPGKTSAVMAYAAREGRPFYAIPSNIGIEPSQLFGKYIPAASGGFEWVDGPVTKIVRDGGVLLINEVNFIPERVATVLFGLLDKRRQIVVLDHKAEVIESHEDLLIVADMNPDYEGTRPLNKAFRNRFSVQLWWDYDPTIESKLLTSKSLLDMAVAIREEASKGTFETPISTNMLMEFEKMALGMGMDFAEMNFINHFAVDERPSIKVIVATWKDNIDADLFPVAADDDDDAGEGEGDSTSQYPEDHPIWEQRANAPEGWVDPEWGVKGTAWVFED